MFGNCWCSTSKWIGFGHDSVTHICWSEWVDWIGWNGMSYNIRLNIRTLIIDEGRRWLKINTTFQLIDVKLFFWVEWMNFCSFRVTFDPHSVIVVYLLFKYLNQYLLCELFASFLSVLTIGTLKAFPYKKKSELVQTIQFEKPMNWCFHHHFLFSLSFAL